MQNNSGIWIGAIVVIVVIIGAFYAFSGNPSNSANGSLTGTGTTTDTTGTSGGTTGGTTGGALMKPLATTAGFASVSSTTAVIAGTVVAENSQTTYWFEYGTTLSFGSASPIKTIPAGTNEDGAAAYLTGLKPNTQYYFRIDAKNAAGIVYGGPYSFTTKAQ